MEALQLTASLLTFRPTNLNAEPERKQAVTSVVVNPTLSAFESLQEPEI
jgi:hypothetical protein